MARRWSRLLVDAIDPVLVGSPFQPGQTGEPATDEEPGWTPRPGASVIWCGPYDEVVATFPHLDRPDVEPEPIWCYDLTVEIDGAGRLSDVSLEFEPLPTAFLSMGRVDDARAAAALLGRPAADVVPELVTLLARIFLRDDRDPI
jgi:hypothetical protein